MIQKARRAKIAQRLLVLLTQDLAKSEEGNPFALGEIDRWSMGKSHKKERAMRRNKSDVLHLRMTEEEANSFKAFANQCGETRSVLLRKSVREMINEPYPDLLQDEQSTVRVVIRQLAGICRNLNQVTTAINGGIARDVHIDKTYLNHIKQHVDAVKEEFLNYLDITRKRKIIKKDAKGSHA